MKHARTKACAISPEVKRIVYERDGGICVICQAAAGIPEAHYISRAQGGLGIPENVFCACRKCHDRYDHGHERKLIRRALGEYLRTHYPDWDETKLYYQKWPEGFIR